MSDSCICCYVSDPTSLIDDPSRPVSDSPTSHGRLVECPIGMLSFVVDDLRAPSFTAPYVYRWITCWRSSRAQLELGMLAVKHGPGTFACHTMVALVPITI